MGHLLEAFVLGNTAILTVTVNANTAPTLTYSNPPTIEFGSSLSVTPATGPSDNGSINSIVVQNRDGSMRTLAGSTPVALISQSAANRFFPGV